MKITICKRFTSVEMYPELVKMAKKFRETPQAMEDMKTCITGIEYINSLPVYCLNKNSVELKNLELYEITGEASFTLKARVCGVADKNDKVCDFIADLSIYGRLTDEGAYFEWDEASSTGAPQKMNTKLYLEAE